jgi:hypothetical protein
MWGSDLWTARLVRYEAGGRVQRLVDFGDLRGASHEDLRTRSFLVPVPLWDACPDGSVVVFDPMARFLYRVESGWEERDSLFVPWDARPLSRSDRLNYLSGQMKAELQGRRVESGKMEAMLARAEQGSRDQFPAAAPLAVDIKCSEGRVWMQEYDGAAHPLGFGRRWRTISLAGHTSAYSEVTLPAPFRLFRASESRLLGVVTDDLDLQRVASRCRSPFGSRGDRCQGQLRAWSALESSFDTADDPTSVSWGEVPPRRFRCFPVTIAGFSPQRLKNGNG